MTSSVLLRTATRSSVGPTSMDARLDKVKYPFIAVLMLLMPFLALAQPVNDDCVSATHIASAINYCSGKGEFTIQGATESTQAPVACFPSSTTDVWFTFFAETPAARIQVNGADGAGSGSLQQPSMGLLQGSCATGFTEIACGSDAVSNQNVELVVDDLVIGGLYYLRIDARNGNVGSFQVCIKSFIPTNEPSADCPTAGILCDKSSFTVEQLLGDGNISNEARGSCLEVIPGDSENSSVWYQWTCDVSGTLTFTLTPTSDNQTEDLDFAVYELPNGINDCSNKILLRCMASGENVGQPFEQWQQCTGPTGLRDGEVDTFELAGCQIGNNNFLKPLDMVSGKTYALIVNNFSQSGRGFDLEWGGTGTFLGPTADFDVEAVQAFECDKTITFTNLSSSPTDSIVSYTWNFGSGATPVTTTGSGPHNVVYESFGDKRAALTVETSRGCLITEIVDLYVEPCCADTSTLDVSAVTVDLLCPGVPTGVIVGTGISGDPIYQFSLDGVNFQPSSVFPRLGPGAYTLSIIDEKGCTAEIDVTVNDAPPFTVNAGDTLYVDLGYPVQLNAVANPPVTSSINWNPSGSLIFESDSLSPVAIAPGTTNYQITVTNPAGCEAQDNVLVIVNIVRPIYIPNVFSPNADGVNDFFFATAGPAANFIESMRIFNRWGALVYEANGIPFGVQEAGWDGKLGGQFVEPGVFAYHLRVQFIDGFVADYSGSVTVVR